MAESPSSALPGGVQWLPAIGGALLLRAEIGRGDPPALILQSARGGEHRIEPGPQTRFNRSADFLVPAGLRWAVAVLVWPNGTRAVLPGPPDGRAEVIDLASRRPAPPAPVQPADPAPLSWTAPPFEEHTDAQDNASEAVVAGSDLQAERAALSVLEAGAQLTALRAELARAREEVTQLRTALESERIARAAAEAALGIPVPAGDLTELATEQARAAANATRRPNAESDRLVAALEAAASSLRATIPAQPDAKSDAIPVTRLVAAAAAALAGPGAPNEPEPAATGKTPPAPAHGESPAATAPATPSVSAEPARSESSAAPAPRLPSAPIAPSFGESTPATAPGSSPSSAAPAFGLSSAATRSPSSPVPAAPSPPAATDTSWASAAPGTPSPAPPTTYVGSAALAVASAAPVVDHRPVIVASVAARAAARAAAEALAPVLAPAPGLRRALVALANEDSVTAGALLAGLLPAQGAVLEEPLSYDLTVRGFGTFAVTVGHGGAEVQRLTRRRSRKEAAFHISGEPIVLAELLSGDRTRLGRFRPSARITGRRKRARELHVLPAASLSLAEAVKAGARLEPALVYAALPYAVAPEWTRGHVFTIAQEIAELGPRAWYVTARDGVKLSVVEHAAGCAADATVTMSRAAFDRLLKGEPHVPGDRPVIRGDHHAVATLKRWTDLARG